jgi:hypothetical protein
MNLPPLPQSAFYIGILPNIELSASVYAFTASQMQEYATAAVLAERERCAAMFDKGALGPKSSAADYTLATKPPTKSSASLPSGMRN